MSDLNERDKKFMNGARHVLDQSAAQIDEKTVQHLRQIRREAVALPVRANWRWVYAFTGVATTVFIAVLFSTSVQQQQDAVASLDDVELLSASEEFEFFEDLEFYQWLESEGETT